MPFAPLLISVIRISQRFAAFRPIKDNPGDEVIREMFKTMLDSGGDEEEIACLEEEAIAAAQEFAAALHDYVNFVAGVRRLRVVPARSVNLDLQAGVLKDSGESFTFWAGQS